jgi:hypothetical protein
VLYPAARKELEREIIVIHVLKEGELERAYVSLRQASLTVETRGLWVAGTWRISTKFNGQPMEPNRSQRVHPRCLEIGSVTSLLILGQSKLDAKIPVMYLREGLESDLVFWRSELDDRGDHQIATPLGPVAFRLNDKGAPELVIQRRGGGVLETTLERYEAFGGAGLPLPSSKRPTPASASLEKGAVEER